MADIRVMASQAFQAAYGQLVPAFERATGHRVALEWVQTGDMLRRLLDGEIADLVSLPRSMLDALARAGRIAPNGLTDFARSGVGLAVPAGAAAPAIATVDDLRGALRATPRIACSHGPSGVHFIRVVEELGLADALAGRIRQVRGEPIGALLARGDADLGVQQTCELLTFPGVTYVGPLPAVYQQITLFAIGLHGQARVPEAARRLVDALTAPAARAIIEASGLEVV